MAAQAAGEKGRLILTFEVALPLGALAFYLYDSALLLHDNELLFYRRGRHWDAVSGSDWVIFRRRVCFPAPFMPWSPVLRAFWSSAPPGNTEPTDWPSAQFMAALRPFQVLCTLLLLLLAVALPVASLTLGSGFVLLGVFAVYYLLVIAALVLLFLRRSRLKLTNRAYWSIAIDTFACAPFAVNLVRRMTLRQTLAADARVYAESHLPAAARERLAATVERKREVP